MTQHGHLVTIDIQNAHPKMTTYPLYEGDLILKKDDGTWDKVAPGIAVIGFILTSEQEATLRPVRFENDGLEFRLLTEELVDDCNDH